MRRGRSETIVAIVVAAGRGSRFGGTLPKQFETLGAGMSVLQVAVRAMQACADVDGIVVVLSEDEIRSDTGRAVAGWPGVQAVVAGGATRPESVRAGLEAATDADYVLVHDAARPLVTPELMTRLVEGVRDHGAVVPGVA
ncbi:MAG: 2-C-methyl-D-erythritol 4-phosphate cytidylyltransferase, partial [Acidobacteriota bacterium]|nr:2-C-methyl-D-erythritol 4-phosphate cytidylyltransferase [Acidobacteriota bacterium]